MRVKYYFIKWKNIKPKNNIPHNSLKKLTRNNSFCKDNIFPKNTTKIKLNQKSTNNSSNNSLVIHSETISKFIQRQEEYLKESNNLIDKIKRESENENDLIYTFNPKINNNLRNLYKKSHITVHSRLYNDSIEKKNKNINKNKKLIFKSEKINKKLFDELYEDYKTREIKKRNLMEKLDSERGYTFIPTINSRNQFLNLSYYDNLTERHSNRRRKKITPEIKGNNSVIIDKKNKLNRSCIFIKRE